MFKILTEPCVGRSTAGVRPNTAWGPIQWWSFTRPAEIRASAVGEAPQRSYNTALRARSRLIAERPPINASRELVVSTAMPMEY